MKCLQPYVVALYFSLGVGDDDGDEDNDNIDDLKIGTERHEKKEQKQKKREKNLLDGFQFIARIDDGWFVEF